MTPNGVLSRQVIPYSIPIALILRILSDILGVLYVQADGSETTARHQCDVGVLEKPLLSSQGGPPRP
jgi:hypothetical protein